MHVILRKLNFQNVESRGKHWRSLPYEAIMAVPETTSRKSPLSPPGVHGTEKYGQNLQCVVLKGWWWGKQT